MRYLPAASSVLALAANAALAQNYPEKPVTMIAPFPAGESVDLVARAVAQQMSELWKQPIVVANRPGAGGNIGAEAVARAAPDGYTLLMGTTALASSPALYAKLGYDLTRDLVLKINATLVESLRAPRVRDILVAAGADAAGNTPDELAGFLRAEMVKWGKVVRAADIKPE